MIWFVIFIIAIIIACVLGNEEAKETKISNINVIENYLRKKGLKPYKTEQTSLFQRYVAFGDNTIWCAIMEKGSLVKDLIVSNFSADNYVCNFQNYNIINFFSHCVMTDSSKKELAIIIFKNDTILLKRISFSSIISVEQIQNGSTIYQKSLPGTIGRALVGGVLAGGAGAIVGSSTTKQKGSNKCTSLITKIRFSDVVNPSYDIVWYNGKGLENMENLDLYTAAQKSLDIIKAIIANNEAEIQQQTNINEGTKTSTINVADEISKLHKLMTDGIITNEEFEAQKNKILNQ